MHWKAYYYPSACESERGLKESRILVGDNGSVVTGRAIFCRTLHGVLQSSIIVHETHNP